MCVINSLVMRVRGLTAAAGSYFRDAAERRRVAREFARLDDRDVTRVLADIGCSREDLRAIINNAPRSPVLLKAMTARLGLEAAFAAAGSDTVRDIERRCTTCTAQARCRRWLHRNGTDDGYKQFCPNTGNFEVMTQATPAPIA
jgi:uncharacterized protein YjiS (DUF1127 family)